MYSREARFLFIHDLGRTDSRMVLWTFPAKVSKNDELNLLTGSPPLYVCIRDVVPELRHAEENVLLHCPSKIVFFVYI